VPYGIAKLAVEHYLHFYRQEHGIIPVCLRYANVYGPRQNGLGEAGVVAIFIEKFLADEQPVINGDGLQTRDLVYVGDVVAANLLALDYPREGTFNIGTGRETDILPFISLQEPRQPRPGARAGQAGNMPRRPGQHPARVANWQPGNPGELAP
jgi:UDP-glucose 4-epimerase